MRVRWRAADTDGRPCLSPRALLQFVMENCLTLAMTQACRYLREPSLPQRDKQFLKRELGTELVSARWFFVGLVSFFLTRLSLLMMAVVTSHDNFLSVVVFSCSCLVLVSIYAVSSG